MTQELPLEEPSATGGVAGAELAGRADRVARVPWAAVGLFVAVSFALAWLVAAPLWTMGTENPAFPLMLTLLASVMMFTPAVAVLVVTFVLRVPARGVRLRFLGIWPLRPAKRVIWFTVAAIFAPILAVVLSVTIAALFGWVTLDLVHFSGFEETLKATLPSDSSVLPPIGFLVAAQLAAIPLGALLNSVFAAGEEIGWRGWLLPALRPLGVWPALILSGVIWGLWHSPLILLGYNFGLTDWRGVALMTAGCMAWGVLLGWSRLRTGSVWPAVLGHGALNASASLVVLLAAEGSTVDPALVSPLGAAGWIAISILVLILVLTGQFRTEPELTSRGAQVSVD